ncbi:MAG: peptide deformylase [Bacilli bacterium]|nr:peptide deformylase [Bacilli bacterium]
MLTNKDIIKDDHPTLRLRAQEVFLPLSDEDIKTLYLMDEYLENGYDEKKAKELDIRPGVGLAAPQINISKQMFSINLVDYKGITQRFGVINPKIISESVKKTYLPDGEGCLSVEKFVIEGIVHRAKIITVKAHFFNYVTNEIEEKTVIMKDLLAIVFQHEYDHLKGILYIDRINKAQPFSIPENSSSLVDDTEV